MSLALFNTVLASQLGKSSTRFALALMAYHACEHCGRVYCGITRLANELNTHPRNTKTLVAKLRQEKYIEPTGETTPQGTIVYRLQGVVISSPDDLDRDEITTGGMVKSCRFCRREVVISSPNKQEAYRLVNDEVEAPSLAHEDGTAGAVRGDPGDPWGCGRCGMKHASSACP
jgi:hypothetical protein